MPHLHKTVRERSLPPYSYLISNKRPVVLPETWNLQEISIGGGLYAYFSKDLECALVRNDISGSFVLVAGLMIDLNCESMNLTEIADALLGASCDDEDAVFRYSDNIAGRYIVVFKRHRDAQFAPFQMPVELLRLSIPKNTK